MYLWPTDIFGLTDHDLMYSQEAVETPEEMADTAFNDAIHARVSRSVFSGGPL